MAEQLDVFKKEFAKLRKEIDDGTHEIKHVDASYEKLTSVRFDIEKEFFQHGARLRTGGFQGDKLADFLKDGEAAKLHSELAKIVQGLEEQNQKGMMAAQKARVSLSKLETLESGIEAEIKDRKKKVSTKLGLGNKSLPDMEKLLKEVKSCLADDEDRETIKDFKAEAAKFYTNDSAKNIQTAIDRINKAEPAAKDRVYDSQLLNIRVLGKYVNKAKSLFDAMQAASSNPDEQKAKAKELLAETEKYATLKVGPETRARFKKDPDGAKVEKFYDGLMKMRELAEHQK